MSDTNMKFLTVCVIALLCSKNPIQVTSMDSETLNFLNGIMRDVLDTTSFYCYYFENNSLGTYILEKILPSIRLQLITHALDFQSSRYHKEPTCKKYIVSVKPVGEYNKISFPSHHSIMLKQQILLFLEMYDGVDVKVVKLYRDEPIYSKDIKAGLYSYHKSSRIIVTLKLHSINQFLEIWKHNVTENITIADVKKWWINNTIEANRKLDLKVASFDCPPFISIENSHVFGGLEYTILNELTKYIPARMTFVGVKKEKIINKWGTVLSMVSDGLANIGACSQWHVSAPNYGLDMTHPYLHMCSTFLVRKPDIHQDSCFLMHPYYTHGGLLILILSAIITVLIYVIDNRYQKTERENQPRHPGKLTYDNISKAYLHVLQLLLLGGLPIFPSNSRLALRFLLAAWSLACGILAVYYSASITSSATLPFHIHSIDSLQDMINYKIHWREKEPSLKNYFKNSGCHQLKSISELFERGKKQTAIHDNSAIVVKILMHQFVTDIEELDSNSLVHSKFIRECFGDYYTVFALEKKFPLKDQMNKYIMRFLEYGLIEHWSINTLDHYNRTLLNDYNLLFAHDSLGNEIIKFEKLQGAFYLLIFGYILGFLVFLGEALLRRHAPLFRGYIQDVYRSI